jgi:serine/threonine protein kinase
MIINYNYLMTPRHTKGSLLALLQRANYNSNVTKLSIRLQRYLVRQVCSGLFYLHTQDGLAHGDIKPDNIIVTQDYKLALIDLGHTENLDAQIQKWTGTPNYRPAEVGTSAPYRLAHADIFSLAVTLLVIMT